MQNRKRVFGRKGRGIIGVVVLASIIIFYMPPVVNAGVPVWIKARNGTVHPDIVPNLNCFVTYGNYLGLISSVSNPYSIDGITDSFLKTGFHNSNNNLWGSWSLLHHALYREDFVKVRWIRKIGQSGFSVGGAPGIYGRRVTGFEYETARVVEASVSFNLKETFIFGYEGVVYDPGLLTDEAAKFMLSIIDPPLSLLVNYSVMRRNDNDFLMGVEAGLSNDLCLLSGYGFNTNEISFGLVYQRNGWYFGFSWNHHQVLGSTLSAGIGMLWMK